MIELLTEGTRANYPFQQWYAESEEDVNTIPKNAPTGSTVLILQDGKGLSVKMKHSDGTWKDI